ncbi:MAG: 5-(carboxyamino)imidazole ribonucleotide mutase [Pseudoclavibacter sp.]
MDNIEDQPDTDLAKRSGVTDEDDTRARVGVIMGSQSDWETMQHATATLEVLGVTYETKIVSAHRTPDRLADYARTAVERGLSVIIAGAGGAAHLPGMCSAWTRLPVLGVPVESKALKGMDSLLSIVQMPAGIPVATVSIGGAKNAGLLAARILSAADPALADRLADYAAGLERMVDAKNAALQHTIAERPAHQ